MSQLQYYVVDFNNHEPYNIKSHDLYTIHFKSDQRFKYVKFNTLKHVENLILSIKYDKNVIIIFYMYTNHDKITIPLINLLQSPILNNISAKIVLFTNDFWYHSMPLIDNCLTNIFTPKNHYIVTFADSLKVLENFHNREYSQYSTKIILNNIWSAYNSSFIELNKNPEIKIVISGAISKHYPERSLLLSFNNPHIERLHKLDFNDNYAKRLSIYICSFASSVHAFNKTTKKLSNTHLITLKYFEILASGSLLLCPDSETKQLNSLGIYNNVNCLMIDISNNRNIISTINFIINNSNRKLIDDIRTKGQLLARDILNSKSKYNEIMTIFESRFNN